MTFSLVATATAVAGLLLALGWIFAGPLLHQRWKIEPTAASLLIGRRLGVAYLGIAVLLFLGRNAPPSDLRSAVSVGLMVSLALLAVLGLRDFIARRVGPVMLVSVAVEVILSAGFAWVLVAPGGA